MLQADSAKAGLIILDLDLAGEDGLILMNDLKRIIRTCRYFSIPARSKMTLGSWRCCCRERVIILQKGSMEELLDRVQRSFKRAEAQAGLLRSADVSMKNKACSPEIRRPKP
jgi:hypothetical protein